MTDYSNDIKRYLSGAMSEAERHNLEKKALSDPFLAEALEGAETIEPNAFTDDIDLIKKRIALRAKARKQGGYGWLLRAAAAVALIITSGYLIWRTVQPTENPDPLVMTEELPGPSPSSDEAGNFQPADSLPKDTDELPAAASTPEQEPKSKKADLLKTEEKITQELTVQEKTNAEEAVTLSMETEGAARTETPPAAAMQSADKAKENAVARKSMAAPSTVVHGRVTFVDGGAALPGVNVIVKGSSIGTVTDANGKYQLETRQSNATLVFSFIGLKTTEVATAGRPEVNVQLQNDATALSEVVVTAMGAQSSSEERATPAYELASPVDGMRAFRQYLEQSIQYPQEAINKKIEGRVTVEFFVEPDGSLTEFTLVRGIGGGCDEELIRLIKEGPRWIPSKQNGQPVRDKLRVRLKFELPR